MLYFWCMKLISIIVSHFNTFFLHKQEKSSWAIGPMLLDERKEGYIKQNHSWVDKANIILIKRFFIKLNKFKTGRLVML